MAKQPEKKRLTEAEAKAREERLRASGITVERPGASTITLARRKPLEDDARRLDDDDGSGAVE